MTSILLLTAQHRRESFDCGDAVLNEFLLRQAGQQQRRGFGKTYVAVGEDGVSVIGFIVHHKVKTTGFSRSALALLI